MSNFLKKSNPIKKLSNIGKPHTSSNSSATSTPRASSEHSSTRRTPSSSKREKHSIKEDKSDLESEAESESSDRASGIEQLEFEYDGPEPSTLDESLLPDIRKNPPEEIALTAANLGLLFGFALSTMIFSNYKEPSIYLMALSIFHFLEFYVTAKFNPKKVHKESFIINNGSTYTVAHTFAIFESAFGYLFFPTAKRSLLWIKVIGLSMVIFGQIIRSWAMVTAGKSFSHLIVTKKTKDHELVTHGIYSVFRHPSYTGFFWWAVGTQLVLVNPISLVGFITILWLFFKNRIEFEEKYLINFFGDQYRDYRKTASVYIPFIN